MKPPEIILYGFVYFMGMFLGFVSIESFTEIIQNALIFMIILIVMEITTTLITIKHKEVKENE